MLSHIGGELGLDAEAVLAEAQEPKIKDALRGRTEHARDLGIFGAPTFVVHGELFWRNDPA